MHMKQKIETAEVRAVVFDELMTSDFHFVFLYALVDTTLPHETGQLPQINTLPWKWQDDIGRNI